MDVLVIVRGLAAGLAATGAMTLVELPVRFRWGIEGLLDWQVNQRMASRILRRPADAVLLPGLGLHFLHGLVLGVVFVLVLPLFPSGLLPWILGPGYGIALFAITLAIHRRATAGSPWSEGLRSAAVTTSFLTRLAYGTVLALFVVWP
ncbi:MAG TPA: hypothetical protein VF992_06420 [Thermoplasmata archaeon]